MNNDAITPASAQFATFPKTIRELITETIAKGGEVRPEGHTGRMLTFAVPVRYVSGKVGQRQIGTVGWFVRDGRNKISSGVHDVRSGLARHRAA